MRLEILSPALLLQGGARAETAPPSAAVTNLCSLVSPLPKLPLEARAAARKAAAGLHLPSFLSFPPPRPLLVAGPSIASAAFPGDQRPDPPRAWPDPYPPPPDMLSQSRDKPNSEWSLGLMTNNIMIKDIFFMSYWVKYLRF